MDLTGRRSSRHLSLFTCTGTPKIQDGHRPAHGTISKDL